MGIFSKSKKNSAPVPTINVNLNTSQDHVFKPNDIVSGHITLSTPIPLSPQAIEASLWGHSSVWTRHTQHKSDNTTDDYHHYRDNVPLFNITFNVLTEKHLQPGRTYTFPFQFSFPEGTNTSRVGGYKDDNDSRWTVHPHRLPPTFMWGAQVDYPDHAMITYGVTGRLVCAGVGAGKKGDEPIEDVAPVIFSPYNAHANQPFTVVPHTKTFALASSALAGQDASSLGFRKKMSDRFSSSTPKLDFELSIEIPDYLTSGSEFRFRSTFNVLGKSHNVVAIPTLTFKVLKLELLDFTFLRAPRDLQADLTTIGNHYDRSPSNRPTGPYVKGHEEYQLRENKTALNSLPDSRAIQLEEIMAVGEKKGIEQARGCEVWFGARVPGYVPPSFASFSVRRSYSVKVKMEVEVAGKKFEYAIESVVQEVRGA
jgi:hypothetical protein